jgi:predicted DNA-binding transcriptional regulator YafY
MTSREAPADLRSVRVPRILRLLRAQPLPAEILLDRLNRELAAERVPEVSLRTVQLDLTWMREHLGAGMIEQVPRSALSPEPPPDLRGHRWFYRVAGAEDVIPVPEGPGFITELEALALQTARAQLGGGEGEGPLAAALGRLAGRLGLASGSTHIPDMVGVNLSAPQASDPAHALAMLRAIRVGDALAMRYQPLDKKAHDVLVQPVRLVLTDGEPYLWAWDGAAAKLKTYKLARVESLEPRPALRDVPGGLDREVRGLLTQAFRGVSNRSQRGRVVVRFSPQAWLHVRRRRLGGAQSEPETLPDGWTRLAFNTGGLEAVRHWVLQFGGEAVVESPAALRGWIRAEAARLAERYADDG